ncbi:hypothetical protein XENTR_v10002641 [Xenopus tropicalis]|nr:testis-expressed protein 43 [Xenopus tropicalis]KAE8635490.1 hypothetical protein XENTR_v10002641 [Xenopus tropicalis]KAE8635491.1 hypothetical protein XENTR_v10002641 [Xenopus tropicalis]|eukprot:XP_002931758.1 PREDICTED: testis-expressed sequence 43 protein [Xenopus tropicalis]
MSARSRATPGSHVMTQEHSDADSHLKEQPDICQPEPRAMACAATVTDIKGLAHTHVPELSRRHPLIPKLYVMPWKHDMVNRKLILKHAGLAGVYKGPHEDTLFLENKERLCHGEESNIVTQKMKLPSQKQITNFPSYSPLSKYQGYLIKQKSRQHCIAQNAPSSSLTTEQSRST